MNIFQINMADHWSDDDVIELNIVSSNTWLDSSNLYIYFKKQLKIKELLDWKQENNI